MITETKSEDVFLDEALRTALRTNQRGHEVLGDLSRQDETLKDAQDKVEATQFVGHQAVRVLRYVLNS